jgi:SNW domain-containing protein 1
MHINDNFAKLSEALFIADRHAREEVKLRAEMQNRLAAKEKREKEEALRLLAQRARDERMMPLTTHQQDRLEEREQHGYGLRDSDDEGPGDLRGDRGPSHRVAAAAAAVPARAVEGGEELEDEELEQLRLREEIRRERAKQRERELRMSMAGGAKAIERRQAKR